jgi:hypothetical protein
MWRLHALTVVLILLAFVTLGADRQAAGAFEYSGAWSDVVVSPGDDAHATGHSLELWKDRGTLVGFLSEYVGPVADPPIGPLQELKFDATSGGLSFSARLTLGVTFSAKHKDGVPSRDLYVFRGTLRDAEVRGTLEKHDRLDNRPATTRDVVLTRTARNSFWDGKTVEEWRDFYVGILQVRGPKW